MTAPSRTRRSTNGSGKTFGSYTLFHILAEGAMGVVFEAEHNSIGRKVALKIVSPKFAAREGFSPQLIDTFMHEARVMGSIDHPNVVTLYDAGVVGQCPFLAMKLVTGGDLQEFILKSGPLREDHTLRLLRDCAAGLEAIHDAGWISRDIKPANILLEQNGNPRLSDFGVAVPVTAVPADNQIAGTPSYLAPEVIHHQTVDQRSDIYSLGASFWYVVTGKVPFDGRSPEDILSLVMTTTKPPPLELGNSQKARGLSQIILHAMDFKPDKRYKNAEEIVHDCDAVLAGGGPDYAMIGNTRKRTFLSSILNRATSL